MSDPKTTAKMLVSVKERLLWALGVLILTGWQGLASYLHISQPAMAADRPATTSSEPAADALEVRVRAVEVTQATTAQALADLKGEVSKVENTLEEIRGMLIGRRGR